MGQAQSAMGFEHRTFISTLDHKHKTSWFTASMHHNYSGDTLGYALQLHVYSSLTNFAPPWSSWKHGDGRLSLTSDGHSVLTHLGWEEACLPREVMRRAGLSDG